jgi:hypothetical protein
MDSVPLPLLAPLPNVTFNEDIGRCDFSRRDLDCFVGEKFLDCGESKQPDPAIARMFLTFYLVARL